jgi:hypothetical protein
MEQRRSNQRKLALNMLARLGLRHRLQCTLKTRHTSALSLISLENASRTSVLPALRFDSSFAIATAFATTLRNFSFHAACIAQLTTRACMSLPDIRSDP